MALDAPALGSRPFVGLQVAGAIVIPKQAPPQIYYLATLLIGIVAMLSLA